MSSYPWQFLCCKLNGVMFSKEPGFLWPLWYHINKVLKCVTRLLLCILLYLFISSLQVNHKVLICVSSLVISSKNQWSVHLCWLTLNKGTEGCSSSLMKDYSSTKEKRSKLHCQIKSSRCLSLPSPEAERAAVQLYATWNTYQSLFSFEVSSCHLETDWNRKLYSFSSLCLDTDRPTNLD